MTIVSPVVFALALAFIALAVVAVGRLRRRDRRSSS